MVQSNTAKMFVREDIHWSSVAIMLAFLILAMATGIFDQFFGGQLWLGELIYWSGFALCVFAIFWHYRDQEQKRKAAEETIHLPSEAEMITGLLDLTADLERQLLVERSKRLPVVKPTARVERTAPGFVYLVKIETGMYKIGLSTNTEGRMSGLSTGLPYELTLIHTIKCRDRFKIEKFFHEKFADRRIKGEWFALNPEDIEYFKVFSEA